MRENYALHKLHSLTGVLPVGFYMVQHLTLNSFTLAGPEKFNAVIDFFEGIPKHLLLGMEALLIWLPLLFHAVYGTMIAFRANPNYSGKYRFTENRMFVLQRWSGIFAFVFLAYHVLSTTVAKYFQGAEVIKFGAWHEKLTGTGYVFLVFYALGVLACSYHLGYGIWNFCIRWGITVSDRSQQAVQKLSLVLFIGVTLLGWGALFGFLRDPGPRENFEVERPGVQTSFTR